MPATSRVIVVGLDGLEPTIVDSMLQAGELPSLARLRASGGYSRIATTTPAQTPVAWSTFSTGTNPGGHGIYDFLRRDPRTYQLDLALSRFQQNSAFLPPKAVNSRRGVPLWELLSKAGVPSTILRMPCTFPPDSFKGRLLAGMGVPDVRGGLGTGTFYSSSPELRAGESEQVFRLVGSAPFRAPLTGPRNPRSGVDLTCDLVIDIDRGRDCALVASPGREPRDVHLGAWSEWLQVTFKSGLVTAAAGMVRFILRQLEPHVELYASPVNFDPRAPLFPISHPWEYANALTRGVGPFYTTGMVEDHAALSNERIDEEAFLAQCHEVLRERERMMLFELERMKEGFFFCLFDTPDRLQHMFWRFREPGHPANRGGGRSTDAGRYARVIEDHYRACDTVVGRAMEAADDRTLFMVLSDHGFTSFQRGVHLNHWLRSNGYLALKSGVAPGAEAGEYLRSVDWGRTRAYALGLGSIYLNIAGREAEGIVAERDAPNLAASIAGEIAGIRDSMNGAVAVRGAATRRDLYSGPYSAESPDLVVLFNSGYRASWTTALGGVPGELFEDNTRKWGGDHIVDPALVPGVLFMSHRFDGARVRLLDMAPTILEALGQPKGRAMEGNSLWA